MGIWAAPGLACTFLPSSFQKTPHVPVLKIYFLVDPVYQVLGTARVKQEVKNNIHEVKNSIHWVKNIIHQVKDFLLVLVSTNFAPPNPAL
jgi:hypothetical protein